MGKTITKTVKIPIKLTIADLSDIMAGKELAFMYGERVEVDVSLEDV